MKLKIIHEGWMRHGNAFSAELSDIEAQTGGHPPRCPKCRKPVHATEDLEPQHDREGDLTHWEGQCPSCRTHLTVFNDHEEKKGDMITEGKTHKDKPAKPRAKHLADILKGRKGGPMRDDKDYVRAREKQKLHKEMNESDDRMPHPWDRDLYIDARSHLRESIKHLEFIVSKYFDSAQYGISHGKHPSRDVTARLARAADMIDNITHTLAAGTPDDREDPMDV